jgi:hypothetical protein
VSQQDTPRGDQEFAADKVEPIAPHRAARRNDSPDLLDALSGAMRAPQMMSQDDVLLGGLGPDGPEGPAADTEPAASESDADPRQLDLLAKSA